MKCNIFRITFSQFVEIIFYFIMGLLISTKFYYIINVVHEHQHSGLNAKEIIQLYNYNLETHNIITEDGYWLTLFRIQNESTKENIKKKYSVLFVHGMFSSSNEFVALGENESLPFILSDAGYDVWLANLRGSTLSMQHSSINLNKQGEKFWSFSLDEIAKYDIPEIIDYILGVSEKDKIQYIGHSTGNVLLFMMLSEKPDYNNKLHHMIALSPTLFGQKHLPAVYEYIKSSHLLKTLEMLRINYIQVPQFILNLFCSEVSLFSKICLNQLSKLLDFNPQLVNEDMTSVLVNTLPSRASINQFLHYLQLQTSDGYYHFTTTESITPNMYDLSRTKIPISIYSETKESKKLLTLLPNVVKCQVVEDENFKPLNFVFANNVSTLVFNDVMKDLK